MKVILQRVSKAAISINSETICSIGKGYVVLLGVGLNDTKDNADKMIEKIKKLRIFEDAGGKINLSIGEVDGEILVISQFTLYADCKKNRPSFSNAGTPETAKQLYNYFVEKSYSQFAKVGSGVFGAKMKIMLENDGPFTVVLEN